MYMLLKRKLKEVVKFILNNIPARKYHLQVVNLAPNELLKNRAALITGGTSGIGFCIAQAFLRSGATVIITSRSIERLQSACNELNNNNLYSNRVFGVMMDNMNIPSFQKCFDDALRKVIKAGECKCIDILVNNAGVLGANLSNATENEFDKVMSTNLKSVFFLSQMFGNYLKINRIEGNILNIASSSSLRPAASAYTLSKWGIRGLTLGLAKSLIPYGITVNGIAPGPTATPMLIKDDLNNISCNRNPIGRYVLPQEIANMAVVLVSPMGKTIIGDIIYMTGGAGTITFDDMDYLF